MSWKYEIFGTWGQRFLVNYSGSSLRNRSIVFFTSPLMRPSSDKLIKNNSCKKGSRYGVYYELEVWDSRDLETATVFGKLSGVISA